MCEFIKAAKMWLDEEEMRIHVQVQPLGPLTTEQEASKEASLLFLLTSIFGGSSHTGL